MICFSSDFMWFYYLAIYNRVCPLNAFMPHSALFSLLTALQTSVSQKDRVNPLGKAPRLEEGLLEVSSPASCSRLGHHWIRLCPGVCWKLPGTETPTSSLASCPKASLSLKEKFLYVKAEPYKGRSCVCLHSNENVKQIQVRMWFLLVHIKNAFSLIMTSCRQLFLFLSLWFSGFLMPSCYCP